MVELANPGRFGFQVAVELSHAPAPRGDVGLPLAFLFIVELKGELEFGVVLAELRFDALALTLQGPAELSRLALATIAQRVGRASSDQIGPLFELRQQVRDVLEGGFEQTAMNRLTRSVGILQRGLQAFEGSRFGLPGRTP